MSNNHINLNGDSTDSRLLAVGTVFMCFAILSFITSYLVSGTIEQELEARFNPRDTIHASQVEAFTVRQNGAIYEIEIDAALKSQSWAFIEGQILDKDKNYLFSFGKELGYYSGRDSDGNWTEKDDKISYQFVIQKAGVYYIQFKSESNKTPSTVLYKLVSKFGSQVPHMWFAIITFLIGAVCLFIPLRKIF